MTYAELTARWNDEAKGFPALVYSQSAAFIDFLRRGDADAFHEFLSGPARRRGAECHFERVFCFTADKAMDECLKALFAEPLPSHAEPPEAVRERVEARLLPLIGGSDTPTDARRRAVLGLGAIGYPWWADILVAILESDDTMRDAARRALESIAGEVRSDDAQWRGWLATVPVRPALKG
jgi:hypothetical protein